MATTFKHIPLGDPRLAKPPEGDAGVPYGNIADLINRFQADQARLQFETNLPGYKDMVEQRSGNIGAQLRGEVPQDVVAQLIQQGAERGIAGGMGTGGPNQNASYLRALGLTSIDQQERGAAGLSTAIADTPTAPLFDVGAMYAGDVRGQQEMDALLRAQRQPPQPIAPRATNPIRNWGPKVSPWSSGGGLYGGPAWRGFN